MKAIRTILVGALLTASLSGAAMAQGPDSLGAGWRARQDQARDDVQSGQAVPLSQVIETIRRRTPGRLLDAGREGPNFRIRWAAADGRRIDFIVDARSGRILSEN